MSLISIILVLAIGGVVLYLINTYIPMAAPFKTAINVAAVVFLILWILQVLGVLHTKIRL